MMIFTKISSNSLSQQGFPFNLMFLAKIKRERKLFGINIAVNKRREATEGFHSVCSYLLTCEKVNLDEGINPRVVLYAKLYRDKKGAFGIISGRFFMNNFNMPCICKSLIKLLINFIIKFAIIS